MSLGTAPGDGQAPLLVSVIWSPWDLATVHTALSPQWGLESHNLKQKPNWIRLCFSAGLSWSAEYRVSLSPYSV